MIGITSMYRKTTALLLAVATLALGGCASGPAFEKVSAIPDNKALIYVYRPLAMGGAAYSPGISIGDKVSFSLTNGGYFPYLATPGKTEISITNLGTRSVTVDAKQGETYYVKGGLVFMGFGIPAIDLVESEVGAAEIQECKRIDVDASPAPKNDAAPAVSTSPTPEASPQNAQAPSLATVAPTTTIAVPASASPAVPQPVASQLLQNNKPVKLGVSSVTVEKLARAQGCQVTTGAELVSNIGNTVENYHVSCSNGQELFAHCEYRQCTLH